MDLGIDGKTALITGGAGGIGLAIARQLASEGCRIVVCDIKREALDDLPEDWLALECDVTSESQVGELFETIVRELGGLDILVNNAGLCIYELVPDTSLENWEKTQRINLTSAFMLSKLALPHMNARGWGRIINIASMAGKLGGLSSGIAYTASKAGMMGITKSLAREAAPGVTSNALAPAFIRTVMTSPEVETEYSAKMPVGRIGEREEVAAAVAYLASDLAGYITGETLDVNGGMLMD